MHTATLFSMILGIFMTIVGIIITPMLLRLMNTPEEVLPQSIAYFRTYFGGVFFTILYNMGSSIFRSIGDSKHPLYFLIISCFINVILDLLFVAVFKWGVIGVGIATIIAQAVSTVLTYGLLIKTKEEYNFSFKELKIDFQELKKIIALGIPSGIQNSIISFANVFIQSNINAFGPIAQAGCGSYSKIEGFATMPSGSFSMALSTYVGQNIGAKKYQRAEKGAWLGLIVDVLITESIGILLFIFAPYLISIFSDTNNVIEVGVLQARTVSLFYGLLAFAHGMSGIMRGAGFSKTPMFIMIFCWVIVRVCGIPIALSWPSCNTIQTIFWFYPFTWGLSFIVLNLISFYYSKTAKKHYRFMN